MQTNWLKRTTTIYENHFDVKGRAGTIEEVLFWGFAKNLPDIISLRKLDPTAQDYKIKKNAIKKTLLGFTPAAELVSREQDNVIVKERTGLLQLDFDYDDVKGYSVEELKAAVFGLSFIALSACSCAGNGFYALVQIAEAERLKDYAQHCFTIFKEKYGIRLDVTKGGNVNDLRYISYDANMLVKDEPTTLRIPVKPPTEQKFSRTFTMSNNGAFDPYARAMKVAEAKVGNFVHGSNAHNFLFTLSCSLNGLGVSEYDARQWIYQNLLPAHEVKTNCIKSAYKQK